MTGPIEPGYYLDGDDEEPIYVEADQSYWRSEYEHVTYEFVQDFVERAGPLTRLVPLPTREALTEAIEGCDHTGWAHLNNTDVQDVLARVLALLTGEDQW